MGLFGPPNVEKMAAKRDVKGLAKALNYRKDIGIQCHAARELGEIGDARAVKALVDALNNPERLCNEAAETLVQIGAPAIQPLIAALTDTFRCKNAAQALAKIGAPAARPH